MSTKFTLRRLSMVATAALFASALLAGGAARSQPARQDMLELKLAVADENLNPVTDSVLKLAQLMGVYRAHGVDVTLVTLVGTPQEVAALNAGHVDVADISIDAALRLRAANNVALRGIMSSTLGPPFLIAAKSDIKDVKGLVGRSFAISDTGSLDHNLTRTVLKSMGVDPDGPRFVSIGVPNVRVQALVNNRVDATTVSYGTYLPIANTPGLSVVVSPEAFFEGAPIQSKFLAVLEPTIAKKREALQRFVAALTDLSRQFDKDPNSWVVNFNKGRNDLSIEQLTQTTKFLAGRWCVNGCLDAAHVQKTVDFIYADKEFADVKRIPASDIIDVSFVAKLDPYKGGGIDARQ